MLEAIFQSLQSFFNRTHSTLAMSQLAPEQVVANVAHLAVDLHAVPQQHPTQTQLTLFVSYLIILAVWLLHFGTFLTGINIFGRRRSVSVSVDVLESCVVEDSHRTTLKDHAFNKSSSVSLYEEQFKTTNEIPHHHGNAVVEELKERHPSQSNDNENNEDGKKPPLRHSHGAEKHHVKRTPEPAGVPFSKFMTSLLMFGVLMFYFYECDYVKIFPQGVRAYSRDTFLFLVFIFFLVASAFTIKPNPDKVLNRDQTEEWKGWMQVMFVWYHYFMAKEWYNWIRVYIACYVWMTGFGNFSFFWVRNDYSLWRLLKMLFRLNFLVVFVVMATNNEYMLYYICAMHTYWFLSVYAFMRVFNSWNKNPKLMALKFAAYAAFNAVIFDVPGMTSIVFRPFTFVLGFHDRSNDPLHEWTFRAGLDHWACFFGMLCAYNYPHFEAFIQYLDSKSVEKREELKKMAGRVVLVVACAVLGFLWYFIFMTKDKFSYNTTHPYSSLIAIVIYIVIRNIHPILRTYHINMFAWLGKITLETYLSQLHIYLLSNARTLLVYLPGYPLLNFSLATLVYLYVSHALFSITNDCSNYLLPNDHKKLLIHFLYALVLFSVSALVAYGISVL